MKIPCPALPPFARDDREAVRVAFQGAPVMEMGQSWRESLEVGFSPARVRVGWREDRLMVFAELTDAKLVTQATENNQRLWTLGDVFEIFLRDSSGERYLEFHVAPNGRRLQLVFSDRATLGQLAANGMVIEDLMVAEPMFEFSHWVDGDQWSICAEIPNSAFLQPGTTLAGRTWLASFSRYDYRAPGTEPVISSTSPHAVASFHRQQEWAELVFVGA